MAITRHRYEEPDWQRPQYQREVYRIRIDAELAERAVVLPGDPERDLKLRIMRSPVYVELLDLGVFTRVVVHDDLITMEKTVSLVGYFTESQLEQYEKNRMMEKLAGKYEPINY